MGEIAEQILEGEMCSNCGVCFEAHGYPVLCTECFKQLEEEDNSLPVATNEEL
jgi:hypothetical protein